MGTNKFRVIPKNHLSTVGYDAKSACSGWKFSLDEVLHLKNYGVMQIGIKSDRLK